MVKLYPPFELVYPEILMDPHSKLAYATQKVDEDSDPLEILLRAEEGDEVAMDITTFEYHRSLRGL
jgi:hypothetical protein